MANEIFLSYIGYLLSGIILRPRTVRFNKKNYVLYTYTTKLSSESFAMKRNDLSRIAFTLFY